MAIVNHKLQFVFFMNPRTASRATANWLLDNVPGCVQPQCWTHAGLDILIKKGACPKFPELNNWTLYQTVRHPCDLMTSHYFGNIPKQKYSTLMSWLGVGAPPLLENGTLYWRFVASFVFRFENLASIPEHFFKTYNIREQRPMLHQVTHKTKARKELLWQQVWKIPERRWAVENLKDLKTFGYLVDKEPIIE